MPKTILTSTLTPRHLLQVNVTKDKAAYFFITDSVERFWMKQEFTHWEEVKITGFEVLRERGSITYFFNGKEYNKLHISSVLSKACYISSDTEFVVLKRLNLSKEKLEEIGVMNQIQLNLKDIPETNEEAEKSLSANETLPNEVVKLKK